MASTGNVFPTVGASVDRAGSTAWSNPGNVVSDNATDASCDPVPSDYLVTSGYGFAIPDGATILGVTVRVEASETGTGSSSYIPRLHSDTTPTLIGSAKSAVTVSGPTKVISTNGGTSDLWGATLTPSIVNSAGFGVTIWSTDTVNALLIDYVTIAIEYREAEKQSSLPTRLGPFLPPQRGTGSSQPPAGALVDAPLGSLPLIGYAPTVLVPQLVSVPLGTLTAVGYVPTVLTPQAISIPLGGLVLVGYEPTVIAPVSVSVPLATLSLAGYEPTVIAATSVDVPLGALELVGYAPTVVAAATVEVPLGTLTLVGYEPTVIAAASVDVPLGSLTLAGYAPDVAAASGSVVVASSLPTRFGPFIPPIRSTASVELPSVSASVSVPLATLTLAAYAPTVLATVSVSAPLATLTLTGYEPSVVVAAIPGAAIGRRPAFGPFLFLLKRGTYTAQITSVSVSIPLGSLTLTGYAPTVVVPVSVSVPLGTLTLAGYAPIVATATTVSVPLGTLSLVGYEPTVVAAVTVSVPLATLALTGYEPAVLTTSAVDVPVGTMTVVGYEPTIVLPVAVAAPLGTLTLEGYAPLSVPVVDVPLGDLLIIGYAPIVSDGSGVISGGRVRKKRKVRYLIKIDGQDFYVDSYEQAVQLLERASKTAPQLAEQVAKRIEKRIRRKGRASTIDTPTISTADPVLQELVANYRERIREVYLAAAQNAETRALIKKKFEDEDEDDAEVLLLH